MNIERSASAEHTRLATTAAERLEGTFEEDEGKILNMELVEWEDGGADDEEG